MTAPGTIANRPSTIRPNRSIGVILMLGLCKRDLFGASVGRDSWLLIMFLLWVRGAFGQFVAS
jgi:hypothetical protein